MTYSASRTSRGGALAALHGVGWLSLYVLLAGTPLLIALLAERPAGRDFWLEVSVGLGFVGLAMMGLQFAVVSRFSSLNAPFGLDVVLRFHRTISFTAMAFVLAHPAIIVIQRPAMMGILNPFTGGWTARFGIISVVALLVLIATSLWRQQLRLRYEVWRLVHGVLAVVIVLTALVHIERVGYYVDGPWKRALWAAMTVVFIGLLLNVRIIKPLRSLRRPWSVVSVTPERGSAWTLVIRPQGHAGIRFLPGQFAWLRIDRSPFSLREHPFSIASSAQQSGDLSFLIKESGDFTSTIGSIEPGSRVFLDGPYGVFSYERNEGPRFFFVAGGVGVAPILSMLRTLADRNDQRSIVLLYGSSTWERTTVREELDELAQRLDLTVAHVLESPPDDWTGERGFVDYDMIGRYLGGNAEHVRCLMCGPVAMMEAVRDALLEHGVLPEHIDHELFDIV